MSTYLLKAKAQKCRDVIAACKAEISTAQKKLTAEQKELTELQRQIEQAERPSGRDDVTDHAVVRYLERVKGLDVRAVRREVYPEHLRLLAERLGDGSYPAGTHTCKVSKGRVITIITKEGEE